MSKQRIRDRKKRIKRIRRMILSGTAVGSVAAVVLIAYQVITPEPEKTPEPIAVIQTEPIALDIYIEDIHIATEKAEETPRTYKNVDFIPLPVPMTDTDQKIVFSICQESDIAFPLVMAIIEHESHFDRTARSQTGDSGYMQINDCNAKRLSALGFSDLYDLEQNVGAGVYILKELFSKYEGDATFVLMAYNAGEKGARDMRESGIYETDYAAEILERAEAFSSYIDSTIANGTYVR